MTDQVYPFHYSGQPSNDPKHPDYQPQIFPNRAVDMEKLQGDLSIWEKTRDRNPPVIQVTPENDVHKPQLILPKVCLNKLSHVMRKPAFCKCKKQRHRSAFRLVHI